MAPIKKPVWWHSENSALLLMNSVSRSLADFARQYPDGFPSLQNASALIIGSDFSGDHKDAPFESICLLLVDSASVGAWQNEREYLRMRYLPDGRRISYKGLNDRQKRSFLVPFLNSANCMNGLLLSIIIDKKIKSFFEKKGTLNKNNPDLENFKNWKISSIEKMLRTVHFISLLLRGLSAPNQDVLWITDQDEIAANEMRLRQLVSAFASVSSQYLPHELRHLRIGTTFSDTGRRDIEDYVAIPDLVAGAMGALIPVIVESGALSASRIMVPAPLRLKSKVRAIIDWFSNNNSLLKRVVLIIDEGSTMEKCRISCVRFHGSND